MSCLLGRELDGDEHEFTSAERASIIINKNTIYRHHVMRVNYTTYDLRREQDSINPRTHPDIMVLSGETDETCDDPHPYWYGCVIGIFHANVLHVGPLSHSSQPQHMEFLFVRWFGHDLEYKAGWKEKKLHRIGFVDPLQVVHGVHLIPAYSHGHTSTILGPSNIARAFEESNEDWQFFYVSMCVFIGSFRHILTKSQIGLLIEISL